MDAHDHAALEEAFSRAVLGPARALIRIGHSSLETAGAERVPSVEGKSIWVANHGGALPIEVMFWALAGHDAFGPQALPRCIVHDVLYKVLQSVPGARETLGRIAMPTKQLHDVADTSWRNLAIFPEGAHGNSKPWWRAYETQRFRTGFARVAAAHQARIIPCAIIGNDECTPVLATQRWSKRVLGAPLPLPASLVPLPMRWKVVFHEPLPPPPVDATREELSEFASRTQRLIQETLDRETADRRFVKVARAVRATRRSIFG